MKSISISKGVKATLGFISCLMFVLSYHFISIACSSPASFIRHRNLTEPALTKIVLLVFSPSHLMMVSAVFAAIFAFVAFQKYAREDDPLHVVVIITICANSIVLFLISFIAAGLLMPFELILGTLH